jgi:hypothetical protein
MDERVTNALANKPTVDPFFMVVSREKSPILANPEALRRD